MISLLRTGRLTVELNETFGFQRAMLNQTHGGCTILYVCLLMEKKLVSSQKNINYDIVTNL